MKYTISVKASPQDSEATKTLIDLIYELLEREHLIERVFFNMMARFRHFQLEKLPSGKNNFYPYGNHWQT